MIIIDDVLREAFKDKRVCPNPQLWNRLWEMLPDRRREGSAWIPSLPLILNAWWYTSNDQKRERFKEHLLWAEKHGQLDRIADYINQLKPKDWHIEE